MQRHRLRPDLFEGAAAAIVHEQRQSFQFFGCPFQFFPVGSQLFETELVRFYSTQHAEQAAHQLALRHFEAEEAHPFPFACHR